MMDICPRPAQLEVLSYQQGTMGIAAVPGSGKTWTLSLLAAELIDKGHLEDDQEVLIVTLVNSAVDNFSQRIGQFLKARNRIPSLGYRVRTLHGLAHDIIKERPELVGLESQFQILDERETERIRSRIVSQYLEDHPGLFSDYIDPQLSENKTRWVMTEKIPKLLHQFALQFIKTTKNYQLTPSELQELLGESSNDLRLAEIGHTLYAEYQESLAYRGAVDFDDLIRLAAQALEQDPLFLKRLQHQWPIILEDEAQDSSLIQERILDSLSGSHPKKNWVRVGDPNQAIYETFTTANPQLLINFINGADQQLELPSSGRSTPSIIKLANYLVQWINNQHPIPEARKALAPHQIKPTPPGDSQTNPIDKPGQIHLVENDFSPRGEINAICKSVDRWLAENPQKTVAILVPRNDRGKEIASQLRNTHDLEPIEHLNTTVTTRKTAGALGNILSWLSSPSSSNQLANVYRVWRRGEREHEDRWEQVKSTARKIASCPNPEDFLSPGPDAYWLESLDLDNPQEKTSLINFRTVVNRWQDTVLLPIDQLMLTLSADLFETSIELAIAHKLATYLGQLARDHPDWGLPALTDELRVLARNERRFFSFESDTGFDPDQHRGQVVVTTIHKSKGLEWDRVYIASVNNYNFPSGKEYDSFIAEKWFIRDEINLPAEGTAQLKSLLPGEISSNYQEGTASYQARMDYVRERIRLLYVAITRAREELVITWNQGRRGNSKPALPLLALQEYWNTNHPNPQ